MALTVDQKNELATRLVNAQQTGNYGSFNDLVKQLRVTQSELLSNFPAINQAGIDEQISRGAVVPKTAPAATTFTTGQVSAAIRDALNAGYTVQQARMGAMTNFGLSSEEFDKALQSVQSSTSNTTFSDARVAQAIRDSLAQGFTIDQARQGAMANYGVSEAQFNRALAMASGGTQGTRGSAPLYQFPGLLADRQDMPTGAQRFLSRAPGSLLFDVPKVQGGEFTFTPGAFDYQAIREQQAKNSGLDQSYLEQSQIQPGTSEYNRLTGNTGTTKTGSSATTTTSTVAPTTTTQSSTTSASTIVPSSSVKTGLTATSQYTDAQVAQAIKESMAQGFSLLDSMAGATRVYGIPSDQAYRAADSLFATTQKRISSASPSEKSIEQAEITPTQSSATFDRMAYQPQQMISQSPTYQVSDASPVNEGLLSIQDVSPIQQSTQFTDSQIAQAIIDSLGQGFDMNQIRLGAFNNFGVSPEQFQSASAMLPSMGYNIGQGFSRA